MGKTHSSLFLAAAAGVGLLSFQQAHADELKCEGPFSPDTTHARLVKAFGAKNVLRKTTHGPEGEVYKASIVFDKDPARSLEVIWHDEAGGRRPARIYFTGAGWSVGNGLHVGASLAELEAANGRPFTLYGFEWDFGGLVSNWKGGALEKQPGGCTVFAMLETDESSKEEDLTKVASDREFSSQDEVMKAVRPKATLLGVQYTRK
ncbi:hypothetical protein AB4072_05360 [Microvirga sp. 2MCAF38]|uniref:hypothetical protein n=1 Tax=Microvirga sp. 2MCAF38 TaxID=3232989 RepID=UPI003F96EEE1